MICFKICVVHTCIIVFLFYCTFAFSVQRRVSFVGQRIFKLIQQQQQQQFNYRETFYIVFFIQFPQ